MPSPGGLSKIPPRVAKRKNAPPRHGLEPYKIVHPEGSGTVRETLFFIMGSTSGRVANYGMSAKIKAFSDLKAHVEDAKAGRLVTSAFALVDTRSLEAEIGILRAKAELADARMKAELVDATMDMKVEPLPTGLLAMPADDLKPSVGDSNNVCVDAASWGVSPKVEDDLVKAEACTSSRSHVPVKLEER